MKSNQRNTACPCSSGKKFKKCCINKGTCHLCGLFKKLSYEHVPPETVFRHVFDKEKTRSYKFWDVYYGVKGKIQQRGPGKNTLCNECNVNTGNWYVRSFLSFVRQTIEKLNSDLLYLSYENYPLQILKQILVMFFSVNSENFQKANPILKKFVLDKYSKDFPDDCKILIYSYLNYDNILKVGVMGEKNNENEDFIYSILSFYPFAFVLCFDQIPEWGANAEDISYFAKFDYDEKKEFSLNLITYKGPGINEFFHHNQTK